MHASFLEAMAPLLVAIGLLWGVIVRMFIDSRRERRRIAQEEE